jgi:tetratricopeptide (TPR) repeat protein
MGNLQEAKKMYERALRGQEMVLGPDHQSTLRTLYNLANVLHDIGNLHEAKKICERAFRGFERVLGPYDQNTLNSSRLLSYITSMMESIKAPSDMSVKELMAAIRDSGLSSQAVGLREKLELVALLENHDIVLLHRPA